MLLTHEIISVKNSFPIPPIMTLDNIVEPPETLPPDVTVSLRCTDVPPEVELVQRLRGNIGQHQRQRVVRVVVFNSRDF